jgi:hypothetical protein
MGFSVKQYSLDLLLNSSPEIKRLSILTYRPESVIPNSRHPKLSILHTQAQTLSMRSPRLPMTHEPSSRSPKPYIAFTTPPKKSNKDLALEASSEAKLEKFHQDMNRSRLEDLKFKKIMNCEVQRWASNKTFLKEEKIYKQNLGKVQRKSTPDERQDFHSDEEDFLYSFTNRAGKVRKRKNKLIKVSRRPDYSAASGYISMQHHSPFAVYEVKRKENPKENLKESLQIKAALSSKGLAVSFNQISRNLCELSYHDFPQGGESLLKYERSK